MASTELLTSPPLDRSVIVVDDSSDDEEVCLQSNLLQAYSNSAVQSGDRKRRRTTVDTENENGMHEYHKEERHVLTTIIVIDLTENEDKSSEDVVRFVCTSPQHNNLLSYKPHTPPSTTTLFFYSLQCSGLSPSCFACHHFISRSLMVCQWHVSCTTSPNSPHYNTLFIVSCIVSR